MTPEQFPIIRANLRTTLRFDAALAEIAAGVEAGAIRNVVLNDAKFTLSGCVNDAWKSHVSAPFFYAGKFQEQPQEVQELGNDINVYGLHEVIAASKKIGKTTATGPAVDAMRAFCAEALPLAQAVAALKDKVIKGRAPNPEPAKVANPDKVVKTCPVCFRPIAVRGSTMAHHGYKRPHEGWQTASCPGVRFKPLEVSSDGLEWLIGALRARLATCEVAYAERGTKDSLLVRTGGSKSLLETITPTSGKWAWHFGAFVSNLESEIGHIKYTLPGLDTKLTNWKPVA